MAKPQGPTKRERQEHMIELLDYFIQNDIVVHFIPAKLSQGSYVNFEYNLFYDERPISKAELVDLIDWWLLEQGVDLPARDTIRTIRGKLSRWLWEEYKRQVHDDIAALYMIDRPKIEFVHANGRPKKAGRTFYIRHKYNIYQRLARNGAEDDNRKVNERRHGDKSDDDNVRPLFLTDDRAETRIRFEPQTRNHPNEEHTIQELNNGQLDATDLDGKRRAKPPVAKRKQKLTDKDKTVQSDEQNGD